MICSISNLLYRWSNGWTAALCTVCYVGFLATVMPQQAAESQRYAGDWGAPDRHFFYTPDELYSEIAQWPESGRRNYIRFRLSLDIVWALAYSGWLITLISLCLKHVVPADSAVRKLNAFPLLTLLSDYGENAAGIVLVANHSTQLTTLAWLAAGLTALKWSTLAIAHGILVYALYRRAHAALSARRLQP